MGLKKRHIEQNEQQIKKVLKSKDDGDEEESNPNEFQDSVLSCLSDLQRLAATMKDRANMMEEEIRRFRTTIHGEDIDAQEI